MGYKTPCLSLAKLAINLIQLTLQRRWYKFLKYVFLYCLVLILGVGNDISKEDKYTSIKNCCKACKDISKNLFVGRTDKDVMKV